MTKKLATICFVLLSMCALAQEKQDTAKVIKPIAVPEGYSKQIDLVYTSGPGWEQKVDLYIPPKKGKLSPAIINIHGGGWNHGTKEQQGGFNEYFKLGFLVANVEYRMTGQAKAPAAIEDIRCCLLYLIKHAKELNIDVDKIVIMGGSAGGHLAMLAGFMGNNHLFDTNCKGVENVHVAAVIDKWGIADMDTFVNITKYKSAIKWLDTKATDQAFIKALSPVSYLTTKSPPVFICHGDADPIVPYTQSVALDKKLIALGIKHQFMTVAGGKHGSFEKEKMNEMNRAIIAFIKELKIVD